MKKGKCKKTCFSFSKPGLTGFTLIELLVVISIIALLMSIMMPALQNARKQAKGIVCKKNLKSCLIGALLYAEDNRNIVFSHYIGSNSEVSWRQALVNGGYVTDTMVCLCPSWAPNYEDWENDIYKEYLSYGMRQMSTDHLYYVKNSDGSRLWGFKLMNLPGSFALYGDSIGVSQIYPNSVTYGKQTYLWRYDNLGGVLHFRHKSNVNVSCADGHVESVDIESGRQKIAPEEPDTINIVVADMDKELVRLK